MTQTRPPRGPARRPAPAPAAGPACASGISIEVFTWPGYIPGLYQEHLILRYTPGIYLVHDVSIPQAELKKSTNLKMHLKPSVQDVWQNLHSPKYTVVGTLQVVGKAVPKLNFGSLGGWLEAGASVGGAAAFESSRGPATRCESKSIQDSKMVCYSNLNGKYLKH